MKTTRRIEGIAVVALVAAALATGSPARAARQMTNGFRTADTRPMTVALVPPHADFIKAKAVMTQEMVKECAALERAAASSIVARLQEKGYTVRTITLEETNADPELKELILRANERWNETWSRMARRPRGVRKERYSAGEEAQALAARLGVDGVAFVRVIAVGVTGGKKALTAILSLGQMWAQGYARLDLGVVDGATGRVEAYFFYSKASNLKPLINKPDKVMQKVTLTALKKYPSSTQILPPKGDLSAEDDEREEDEVDDAEVLGELEALLGPDRPEDEEDAAAGDEPRE